MQPMVNIALRAAREAGEMIVKSADNLDLIKVDEKGRHDFVTEVDDALKRLLFTTSRKPIQIMPFGRRNRSQWRSRERCRVDY